MSVTMEKIRNYINGELCEPVGLAYINNVDPSKGEVYSLVPDSGGEDVSKAVAAAEAAFPAWSSLPVEERSALLLRLADLVDANAADLARAESIDNGKPEKLARSMDISRASANLRFYATAALHLSNEAFATNNDAINYTSYAPIGVVACISPWNLPLYLFTWKVAPALASGCTVVAKPSELAPMTAFLFSKLCIEAGLPAGVLNIIHGTGPQAGQAIVDHPSIKAISFTGGTATGRAIAASAAPQFKRLSLELGGKNPNIIFADCDFDAAVAGTIRSSFLNQGEICLCGSRIFVERSIYDKFIGTFVERVRKLRVGDPSDETTDVGALISEAHMNKVLGYIDLARSEGGSVLVGGERVQLENSKGYFVTPAVIAGLNHQCRTNQEEIFGPVVTVQPFDAEDEVIEWANSTTYGLSATVWTENVKRAHRVASLLKSGIVWVNCWLLRDLRTPFGGVKNSGIGREGGFEALKFFCDVKNVCIKL